MTWRVAVLLLPGFVAGLTLHEFAHAWSASLLGDDFARRQGRVSLNPLRHLSPLGTAVLFWLGFGWGKPVPVNLYHFRRPKRDYLLTSLAGPAANVLLVGVCLAGMLLTRNSFAFGPRAAHSVELAHLLLQLGAIINAILAAINLLPVPPLDGSKIWPCLLPGLKPTFAPKLTRVFVVVLIVLLWTNQLDPLLHGVIRAVGSLAPESDLQKVSRLWNSAEARLEAKDYAAAEREYTEALALKRWSWGMHYERASARIGQENWRGALEDLNEAIRLRELHHPGDPDYYELRAVALEALGLRDRAEKDRARAAELRGQSPEADAASQPATDSQPAATEPADSF